MARKTASREACRRIDPWGPPPGKGASSTADKARPSTENADTDSQIRRYVDTVERWRAAQRELETATAALTERVEKAPEGALSTDVWRVTRDAVTGELRVELRSHR